MVSFVNGIRSFDHSAKPSCLGEDFQLPGEKAFEGAMGSACCCLRDDFDGFADNRCANCICPHYFIRNLVHMYMSLFHRGEEARALPSSTQGISSLTSDSSLADMYHSPPRPLPYDVDTRHSCMAHEGPAFGREKGSSHSNEETETLRPNELEGESNSTSTKGKWNYFSCQETSKECYDSKSSPKLSAVEPANTGFAHIYTNSEDEDVCPTCLEEYTTENPKMVTKCCHHFHLGCIYEWMERSDNCPVCGNVMAFDETA